MEPASHGAATTRNAICGYSLIRLMRTSPFPLSPAFFSRWTTLRTQDYGASAAAFFDVAAVVGAILPRRALRTYNARGAV